MFFTMIVSSKQQAICLLVTYWFVSLHRLHMLTNSSSSPSPLTSSSWIQDSQLKLAYGMWSSNK